MGPNNKSKQWVNLLHIYQPPWQDREVLLPIYEDCYNYILDSLEKYPQIRLTLNISGSLTEQLVREQKFAWIDRVRRLVAKKQIELVGSAMYHPILPLLPEDQVIRQIKLNEEYNSHWFKDEWTAAKSLYGKRGFFPPEVAYSPALAELLAELGYDWVVIDEGSMWGQSEKLSPENLYQVNDSHLGIMFRYRANNPVSLTKIISSPDKYFLTTTDGEIYGNRRQNSALDIRIKWEDFIGKDIEFLNVGEYMQSLPTPPVQVNPSASNWEMSKADFKAENYYSLWLDPKQKLHQKLWEFTAKLLTLQKDYHLDDNLPYVDNNLDKALSSCTWWWVDGRFGGYNPTEVSRGLHYMINTVRTFKKLPLKLRLELERNYADIEYLIWEQHWKNQA